MSRRGPIRKRLARTAPRRVMGLAQGPALARQPAMHHLPEMRARNAAFFAAPRMEMPELPEALSFDLPPVPGVIEPDHLFTQVCGHPFQTVFAGQARLRGVPTYKTAITTPEPWPSHSRPHCSGWRRRRVGPRRSCWRISGLPKRPTNLSDCARSPRLQPWLSLTARAGYITVTQCTDR